MSKALATMHLNSSVYELMERADGEGTEPLYKQINNPILVQGVALERRIQETSDDLEREMVDYFQMTPDQINMYWLYPMEKIGRNQKINMTVAYGWMVEWIRPDPKKPVAIPSDNPKAAEEALKRALSPQPIVKPFFLVAPETDEYMFSISLDHVPATAITKYTETVPDPYLNGDVPPLPMGVDMKQAYISGEDRVKFTAIQDTIKLFIEKWEKDHADGTPPPSTLNFLELGLVGDDKLFKTEKELEDFVQKYAYMLSTCLYTSPVPEEDMQ